MGKKQKINWILILQAWAMLWVVIGHAPLLPLDVSQPGYVETLWRFAYSFHMPLFIFVSGYLFQLTRIEKSIPYRQMAREKLERLGIPFLVFTLLAMVLKTIFADDMARPSTISVREFATSIVYPGRGPLGELWFIATLFWMFALQPIWKYALVNGGRAIAAIILLVLINLFAPEHIDLLCISSAFRLAVFFFAGMCLRRFAGRLLLQIAGGGWKLPGLFLLTLIIEALCWGLAIPLLLNISGIMLSVCLALLLDRTVPKIFAGFRNYTYQIFLMGIFVQILIKMLYKRDLIPGYLTGYLLCILCGLYLPVAVSWLANRLGFKLIKLSLGLTK